MIFPHARRALVAASNIASHPRPCWVSRSPELALPGACRRASAGARVMPSKQAFYAAMRSGPAYLAAAFAFTKHWMSTDRFAFASNHLNAEFNAQSYGGRLEGG